MADEPDVYTEALYPDQIREMVSDRIEANRGRIREARSQEALDRCAEVCLDEDEIHLASAILILNSCRLMGVELLANQALMQLMIDLGPFDLRCKGCGCTDGHACEGGCHRVRPDLCSACYTRGVR
jgi:hypothetical protein